LQIYHKKTHLMPPRILGDRFVQENNNLSCARLSWLLSAQKTIAYYQYDSALSC